MFSELVEKYGDEFPWFETEDTIFIKELNRELKRSHPLYKKAIKAIAKNGAKDDVLFLLNNDDWAIVHLTYSKRKEDYLVYKIFPDLSSALEHIEMDFLADLA